MPRTNSLCTLIAHPFKSCTGQPSTSEGAKSELLHMLLLCHQQLVGIKGNGTVSLDYVLLAVQIATPTSSLKVLISWIQFIFLDKLGEVNESITAAAVALHDGALLVLYC